LYQNGYYLEDPSDETREAMVQQSILTCWSDSELPDSVICDPWLFEIVMRVRTDAGLKLGDIVVPKRGVKLELLESARQNARLAIGRIIRDRSIVSLRPKTEDIVDQLQQRLALRKRPERIIGVDISHLQGTNIVGSAVYFKGGNPFKTGYRKMMVRSVSGDSNDPQSIYEVVSRRIQLCFTDHEPLPDLMLIDGGRGQLNYAYKALVELGVENEVELVSLAKQNEELFRIDDPNSLVLSRDDNVLKLLQWIRDESHRFAVTFQRKKRKQQLETSLLHTIPGLGPKRIQKLYRHFQNVEKLLQASDLEIAQVGGFSASLAWLIRTKIKDIATHE
jgi:excinuclease ABC subunit C